MNVLSLFDGMSCGQIALERVGIKVDNYFASEIDASAMKVAKHNYPNIQHIGDVVNVRGADLPQIDLLIGGSPCQGFSFAGKQLNFNDPRSKLFFEFVRLLKETKPKYFLLENVKMKQKYQDVISENLGVKPLEINSNLVSAQHRRRLYWTNILGLTKLEDKGIRIKDILEDKVEAKYFLTERALAGQKRYSENYKITNFAPCLTTELAHGTGKNVTPKAYREIMNVTGEERKLTPVECERLQNVPDNYSACVSNTQRYKMLGNGWTVDVIAHIFKNIPLT